jgi:hypothetical protein
MARADELIRLGEEAALDQIENIRRLLEPAPEKPPARWYQFRRRSTSQTLR